MSEDPVYSDEILAAARSYEALKEEFLAFIRVMLTRYGMNDPDLELHPDDPQIGNREWSEQNVENRCEGKSWPMTAETMIGLRRLTQLDNALSAVRAEEIPGDFAECGVWRGGASIYAALYFAIHKMDRHVWAFDSFEGLPEGRIPQDEGSKWHSWNCVFGVDEDRVRRNFVAFGVPLELFSLIRGWFRDSLPEWTKVDRPLSVLRVDADMYEGTHDALEYLYPQLSRRGIVIVDDFGTSDRCKAAVLDYRAEQSILSPLVKIDHTAIVWRKS